MREKSIEAMNASKKKTGFSNQFAKAKALGIDIPKSSRYINNEEVFKKDSTYSPQRIRSRFLKENFIVYECSECNNQGKWNNKDLTLQLDHINGINNDNRLDNLRWLCPNCHTQQETYGKKNYTYQRSRSSAV